MNKLEKVNRVEVIDHSYSLEHPIKGRVYVKDRRDENDISVKIDLQDDNRTLKIFIDEKDNN